MIRVFLDSSVWIGGLIKPGGVRGAVLSLAESRTFLVLSSPWVATEVGRWLGLLPVKERMPMQNHFLSLMHHIQPHKVQIEKQDLEQWAGVVEKDRHILAAAVIGRAEALVSDDVRHLLPNPVVRRAVPQVLGPLAFLHWIQKRLQP